MIKAAKLKGFPDFEPKEQAVRQYLIATIARVYESYGFLPMSTPALEYKEILTNKYGEDEKLLYSFTDHGGREVAMRYDLTVPLARFVAERKGQIIWPFKRYQIGPVWRADNTQKGRLREFYQCDVDVVGAGEGLVDAEVVAATLEALTAMGVKNSVAQVNDRRLFSAVFSGADSVQVLRAIDKFDKEGEDGVVAYLTKHGVAAETVEKVKRYLRSGVGREALIELSKEFPVAQSEIEKIQSLLLMIESSGVGAAKVQFNPRVVRGLDYYTGLVFELTSEDAKGFGSLGGGGRYDSLLSGLGGGEVPAVGGSIGFDRVFEFLLSRQDLPQITPTQVLVVHFDDVLPAWYLGLASQLRAAGLATEVYAEASKLDKQFKYAEGKGIGLAVLVGQKELESHQAIVRDLVKREQTVVNLDELSEAVLRQIG